MFFHTKRLQYDAVPSQPDPCFAKKLQEVLGGQFGEISVMMQYLFQGFNCRGPAKYRDMIMDIGTEEIGHVEMLATMIAQLLSSAPGATQEEAAQNPIVRAVLGGGNVEDTIVAETMNPQHFIVSGLGATPSDSVGFPWTSRYIIASGNMMADFHANLNAEIQGRLQVVRLYELTEDPGVRDLLSFLIARDSYHQNQWMAAIAELQQEGLEGLPCPMTFPRSEELTEVSRQFINFSEGEESAAGSWAQGELPDGTGAAEYLDEPVAMGSEPLLSPAPPMAHGTGPAPVPPNVGQKSPA